MDTMDRTYGSHDVARITGLSLRQLQHLAETHGLGPSRPAHGSGDRHEYTTDDLAVLSRYAVLRRAGLEVGAAMDYATGERQLIGLADAITRVQDALDG